MLLISGPVILEICQALKNCAVIGILAIAENETFPQMAIFGLAIVFSAIFGKIVFKQYTKSTKENLKSNDVQMDMEAKN